MDPLTAGIIIAQIIGSNNFQAQSATPAIVILTRARNSEFVGGVLADCVIEDDQQAPLQVVCP